MKKKGILPLLLLLLPLHHHHCYLNRKMKNLKKTKKDANGKTLLGSRLERKCLEMNRQCNNIISIILFEKLLLKVCD